jgi:hypothetical protein
MKQTVQKYLSLFFLFIFLFPLVDKEIHGFEHAGDPHCTSKNKHFHKAEHNCPVCDYTFTSSETPKKLDYSITIFASSFSYIPSINSIYELNTIDNSGSRAPPIV